MLTPEEIQEIEHELALVPRRSGACIDALKTVQRHRGWVSDEAVADVAEFLDMSAEEVDGVATFYNLIFRRPVGRHVIFLCDSVSCWIMGLDPLRRKLEEILEISLGETTADDRFTLLPIPCLGTCDHAPAMMIDDDLHQDVSPDNLRAILDRYE